MDVAHLDREAPVNAPARRPVPPHNPEVEAQRPGWCVYSETSGQFLAGFPRWGTARDAKVFATLSSARYQALVLGCVVTSVPRFNGHAHEWELL